MIKALRRGFSARFRAIASRHGGFALAVDWLGSSFLRREAQAVAAGRLAYENGRWQGQRSFTLLRRNIHRLEKGLIMRPRRAEFGLEFILPTVQVYVRLQANLGPGVTNDELIWSHDVLTEYFSVVRSAIAPVAEARALFAKSCSLGGRRIEEDAFKPFKRALINPSGIDLVAMQKMARYRRSVRWYLPRPVPRDLLDEALKVAQQAPSACNRQSFHFRVFDDPEMVQAVIEIPLGTGGFGHNVPAVAVVVGRLRAYPSPRDRHAIYVDGSLAAMSLIFALESAGLASCLINWADQEPQESRMALQISLAPDERIIVLIAFGYPDPDGMVPFSAKRELADLRKYN